MGVKISRAVSGNLGRRRPIAEIRAQFREQLSTGGIVAPGVHDALAAKIAEDEGFEAVYLSGNAASSGILGQPDMGLATLTDMTQRARGVTGALGIPVVADADTGYGDELAVARTVREFEAAGVCGIHIEDQDLPKRCGAMPGVRIVDLDESLSRLEAALAARTDPNFLVIGRTDALATGDYDDAIRRASAYAEVGADLVIVEDVTSAEQVESIPRDLPGVPLMFDSLEAWLWSIRPAHELFGLGYRMVIMCLSTTLAYAHAARSVLRAIRKNGTAAELTDQMMDLHEYERILGVRHE